MRCILLYLPGLCIALFVAEISNCQVLQPNSHIIGKWINADTGFDISARSVIKMYQEDSSWKTSGLNSDEYFFVDSTLTFINHELCIWITNSFTSERIYLTDGTEESIETTAYKILKFKLLTNDKLQLITSRVWYVNGKNQNPEVLPAYQIKRQFKDNPLFNKPCVFKRLKNDNL